MTLDPITSRRRLGFRPAMRSVLWGGREGDRQIGSPQDLELARRERELAELNRRLMAAAAKRLEALGKAGLALAPALEQMREGFRTMAAAMPKAADVLAAAQRDELARRRAVRRRAQDRDA